MIDPREMQDSQYQTQAEQGEAQAGEALRYRRLFAALREAPGSEPPPGFADAVARAVTQPVVATADERWEQLGVRLGLSLLWILSLGLPLAAAWWFRDVLALRLAGVPWPLLLATAAGLALLASWDRGQRHHESPGLA